MKSRTDDRHRPGGPGVGRLLAACVVSRFVGEWWCFDGGRWWVDDGGCRGGCVLRKVSGHLEEIRSGRGRVAAFFAGALLVL